MREMVCAEREKDRSAPLVLSFFVRHTSAAAGFSSSDEDLGEGVRSGAGNVWLRRVEGHVEDRLVELLAMRGDLLHARLVVQVPQPD